MIDAKIICDSLAPSGVRLTTFVLTYPRFIHAELMTHRVFSRNASSSRAIPVKKQIQMVIDNPAIPIDFRKNMKGMQAGELIEDQDEARRLWLSARDSMVIIANSMADMQIHKQYANRILEPFAHISVVLTATDFSNWFALRCHPAAQPEIHALADLMYNLYSGNEPIYLESGEWHIPFVDLKDPVDTEDDTLQFHLMIKKSVARCPRVSYLTH